MPKSPKTSAAAVATDHTADDIEAAFYEALQHGDLEALMRCWADEDEVMCVHPGGPRLVGPGEIRAAFEQMFSNGTIRATFDRVRKIDSLASSVHSVIERIEVMTGEGPRHAWVIATNVYLKTPEGWRMVAHHASPATLGEPPDGSDAPQTLH